MKDYIRSCPRCNKPVKYANKSSFWVAKHYNRICKSCSISSINSNRTELDKSNRNSKISESHTGKIVTDSTKVKMRESHIGRAMPSGTGEKISIALSGKSKTDSHRLNLRLAKIKDLKSKFGEKLGPNYSSFACTLFNEINEKFGWNGKHAENGGEVSVIGYWLDYYEPDLNLVIEYDEKSHKYRKEQDERKEKEVIHELKCRFVRINEGDSKHDVYAKIERVL